MYGNAADFTTYHEDRGRDVPADWSDAEINAALLLCSEWIDNVYGCYFYGYKTGGFTQQFEWPRTNAFTNTFPTYLFATDEIPERVDFATYEAAFRELTTPGSLMVDYTPGKYKKVSISGAIAVEYAGFSSAGDVQTQVTVIDSILKPLFDPDLGAGNSKYSGKVERV